MGDVADGCTCGLKCISLSLNIHGHGAVNSLMTVPEVGAMGCSDTLSLPSLLRTPACSWRASTSCRSPGRPRQ